MWSLRLSHAAYRPRLRNSGAVFSDHGRSERSRTFVWRFWRPLCLPLHHTPIFLIIYYPFAIHMEDVFLYPRALLPLEVNSGCPDVPSHRFRVFGYCAAMPCHPVLSRMTRPSPTGHHERWRKLLLLTRPLHFLSNRYFCLWREAYLGKVLSIANEVVFL